MDESTRRIHHHDSMRQALLWALISTIVLFLIAPSVGDAQEVVTTNITSTTGTGNLGTTITHTGNLYDITGGTRPGSGPNLFHSFGDFTVGSGDIANFLNTTPQLLTSNILSRVTGGNISNIDGTVQTTGFGNANLFLVNPAGIVFGPNGSVNVSGSVSFTTAHYLRLFDGVNSTNFYANPASDALANSVLAVAPAVDFGFLSPASYGFLTQPDPSATITVRGSMLHVQEGQSVSLVGGDITMQAGTLMDGTPQAASLRAPGGQLNLVSVASPGEVHVPGFQTDSFTSMGVVTIQEGALLDVGAQFDEFGTPIGNGNSGTVFVRGGQLVMDASAILANTVGAVDGASRAVDIQVSQDVLLSNSAVIFTGTSGSGQGGDVVIEAESVHLSEFSGITTGTSGSGQGGDVVIEAENVRLSEFSTIGTDTSGPGSGGDLFLHVGTLSLLGGFILSSTTGIDLDFDGVVDVIGGVGGNVTVQGLLGAGSVADSVVLLGGSRITSEAKPLSEAGGRISITATTLGLDEASSIGSSTTVTETDLDGDGVLDVTGRGGDIVVAVQRLSVVNGAAIASSAGSSFEGAADGGAVTVQGLGGPGSKASSVLLSGPNSGIVSDSSFDGLPGDITVNAGTLTITNGAVISAGSPFSIGPAGEVTVTSDSIVISAGGQILSRSFAQDAGNVTIKAKESTLDNGSIVTSTASERGGRGGDVVLNGGIVSLTNGASIKSQSETFSTGSAGDITMNVESLTLTNNAEITSSSIGTMADAGDAGNITVQSGSTVVLNSSSITTEASQASGGQIEINAPEMVRMTNSRISTSVQGATGDSDGGKILIDPQFVILQNSQIIAQANAGTGGTINIIAGVFIADPTSIVDASAKSGNSGTVTIQSPVQNISGEVTPMSQEFTSAVGLLAQQCAARVADGKFSTFVVAGREGLPVEPGGFLGSPSLTADLLGSSLSGRNPHGQFPAVTGLFHDYDARPIQLAKFENACH